MTTDETTPGPADEIHLVLGPCCICETTTQVHIMIMLAVKGQVPGHGWGCPVCGLAMDGACAVVCGPCAKAWKDGKRPLRYACRGFPSTDGRVLITELTEPHEHDPKGHPEALH